MSASVPKVCLAPDLLINITVLRAPSMNSMTTFDTIDSRLRVYSEIPECVDSCKWVRYEASFDGSWPVGPR